MKKQKKSQISFEYIIIFSFILLLFLIGGSVMVLGLEKTKKAQFEAEYLAKQIKVALITASLSETDFSTTIKIPESIAGNKIYVDLFQDPDNIVIIKQQEYDPDTPGEYDSLAREFLPIIYSSDIENFADGSLLIEKKDEKITVSH